MSRSLSRLAVQARVLLPVAVAACGLVALAGQAAPASGAITRARAVIPAIVNPKPVPVAYAGSQAAGYPFCADIVPVNPVTNAFGTPLIAPTASCNTTTPEAYAIAVSPNGLLGYVVTNQINSCANGYVVPVNLVSGQAYSPIPVGDMLSYNGQVPGGIAITPDGATAYVSNSCGDTVTPINLLSDKAGPPITVGSNPTGIAIAPDGDTAYVTDFGSNTVVPIDLATGTTEAAITVGPAGSAPDSIAITPDGSTAYVTIGGDNAVIPIDLATATAGTAIPIPGSDGIPADPDSIAITPDGATAYVANFFGGSVTPVNLATQTAGTPINLPGFNFPESIAIDPNGSVAYTADNQSGLVVPINLATNTPGAAQMLPGDSSQDVTFSPGWVNRSGLYLGNANVTPGFARYKGALYAAFTTPRGGISYARRTGSGWSRLAQVKGSWGAPDTRLSPALASYDGKLYAFWTAAGRGAIGYSAFNGTSWSRPGAVSGRWGAALSTAGPAVTYSLGSLFAAWKGKATDSVHYSDLTGTTWSKQKSIPDSATTHAPALAPLPQPVATHAEQVVVLAWTEPSGQIGYGQISPPSGFQARGTVSGALTDAAPALAYVGGAADGTLYLAWKGRDNSSLNYSAMFNAAQDDLYPGDWTRPESQPQAATQASPALAGAGYDLYLGWSSRTSKYLFYSYAENPY